MKLRRILKLLLLALLVAMSLPVLLWAQEAPPGGVRLGSFRLYPSLALDHTYTSNFFLLPFDQNSNWIFTQSPQVMGFLPFGRHSAQASYRADLMELARFRRFNRQDQTANGLLDFNFPGGLGVKVSDTFTSTAVPPDFLEDRDLFYRMNFINGEVSYKRADLWKARVGYGYQRLRFRHEEDKGGDFGTNVVNAEFDYKIAPKLMGLVEFIFKDVNNQAELTDNRRYEEYLGVIFDPTAKLTGTFKIGAATIDYITSGGPDDRTTLALSGSLLYRATSFDDVRLEVARNIVETSAVSTDVSFGDNFISTGFTTSWDHRFRGVPGLSSTVLVRYTQDRYKGGVGAFEGRKDHFVQYGLGAAYTFGKYYKIDGMYTWKRRNSKPDRLPFNDNDYEEHRPFIRFTISL